MPMTNENIKCRVQTALKPVDANSEFYLPLDKRSYKQQYANIYFMRLELQRKDVIQAAEAKWGSTTIQGTPVKHARKVLEVEPDVASWVVGTIYKEMKYKPNILEDITASHYGAPPVKHEKYIGGENDEILLEDESGRLKLVGDFISRQLLVTGVVVAVLGAENSKGEFDVIDMVTAGLAPQEARFESTEKKYVALVSGLSLGQGADVDAGNYSWTLLQEYLTGELGGSEDEEFVSQISRLIIAGDSIVPDSDVEAEKLKKKQEKIPLAFAFEHPPLHEWPIDHFDAILAELAQSIPVSVMPGDNDPATSEFPQQPLQSALFARSKIFIDNGGIQLNTNPYWWDIDGIKILGSSGQPIDDIYKYSSGNDRISMMEACLRWRHIAPTAPDTLWTYPFLDTDPFVLAETPHVYFTGNQPYYDTKYIQEDDGTNVRLISLPKFSKTGEFVLLDLNSLECTLVSCK